MVSIKYGPNRPHVVIDGQPAITTTPEIPASIVPKLYEHFKDAEKVRYNIDEKTLALLTMAIPNDLLNRVDRKSTTKELWDELEKQFQGTENSIQEKLNQCIGAYEGFKDLQGESLADAYSRFNIILNDLGRNGLHKTTSEINYKFFAESESRMGSLRNQSPD